MLYTKLILQLLPLDVSPMLNLLLHVLPVSAFVEYDKAVSVTNRLDHKL